MEIRIERLFLFSLLLICICSGTKAQFKKTNMPPDVYSFLEINNIILACTYGDGIYRSFDNGASWKVSNNGLGTKYVFSLSKRDNEVYASTTDGIFYTTNYGERWKKYGNTFPPVYVFTTHFQGDYLIAGTNGEGILITFDNGKKWYTSNEGLPLSSGAFFVHSLAYDFVNLYAACDNGGLYKSKGITDWQLVRGLPIGNCRLVKVINSKIYAFISGELFFSDEEKTNWTTPKTKLPTIYCLANSDTEIYAGTKDGVYFSNDEGKSWKSIQMKGMSNKEVFEIHVNNESLIVSNKDGTFFSPFSEIFNKKENNKEVVKKTDEDVWLRLEAGKQKNGFEYSTKGYLSFNGKKFLDQILFTIYMNGRPEVSIPPAIYISPLSPNKRYIFITGCEEAELGKCNFSIFKLLDLINMSIIEANDTKYGPQPWVKWSKSNKFAILYDSGSGLLQSVNLESKKIKTLPLAERDGVGTIYNLSNEYRLPVLTQKGQWASVDEKSFKWSNKEETKFIAKMEIMPEGERSYWVEADLLTNKVMELK
jgi:hypothetical protein